MTEQLTAGGPNPYLPENWRAPFGYASGPVHGALWIGPMPAEDVDVEALEALGGTPEKGTLVGTWDITWDAPQYQHQDASRIDEFETLPRYGGDGSAAYRYQKLPVGMEVAKPRDWIHEDGEARRAEGGEAVARADLGDGHFELHVVGIRVEWNTDLRLWQEVA